jgi:hypothetical protein
MRDDDGPVATSPDETGLVSFPTRPGRTYVVRLRDAPSKP